MGNIQKIANPTVHDAGYRILSESQLHILEKNPHYIEVTLVAARNISIDTIEYTLSKTSDNATTITCPNSLISVVSLDADFKNFSEATVLENRVWLRDIGEAYLSSVNVSLLAGEILYLRFYPYDAGDNTEFFNIIQNSFIVKEGAVTVAQWDLTSDYTFTYSGADFSDVSYRENGVVQEQSILGGGRWNGFSVEKDIEIFDSRVLVGGDHSYPISSGQTIGTNYRLNSSINNKTFNLLYGDLWRVGQYYDGLTTSFVANLPAYEISQEGYIKLIFVVRDGYNIIVNNISFEAASNSDLENYKVSFYDLKYKVNGGDFTTLVSERSLSETSASAIHDINDIAIVEILESNDIFELFWFPYGADLAPLPDIEGFFLLDGLTISGLAGDVSSEPVPTTILTTTSSGGRTVDATVFSSAWDIGASTSLIDYNNSGSNWGGFNELPQIVFNINPFELNIGNQNSLFVSIGKQKAKLFLNGSLIDSVIHGINTNLIVKQQSGELIIGSEDANVDIAISNHIIINKEINEFEAREFLSKGNVFTKRQSIEKINILPLSKGSIYEDNGVQKVGEYGYAFNSFRSNPLILDLNLEIEYNSYQWEVQGGGYLTYVGDHILLESNSSNMFLFNTDHNVPPMEVNTSYTLRIDWKVELVNPDTLIKVNHATDLSTDLYNSIGGFERRTDEFIFLYQGGIPLNKFRVYAGNTVNIKNDVVTIYRWEIIKGVQSTSKNIGEFEGLPSWDAFREDSVLKEKFNSLSLGEADIDYSEHPRVILDSATLKTLGTAAEDDVTFVTTIYPNKVDDTSLIQQIYSNLGSSNSGTSFYTKCEGENLEIGFSFKNLASGNDDVGTYTVLDYKNGDEFNIVLRKSALTYKMWVNEVEVTLVLTQSLVNGNNWDNNSIPSLLISNDTIGNNPFFGSISRLALYLTNLSEGECLLMSSGDYIYGVPSINIDFSDSRKVIDSEGSLVDLTVSLGGYLTNEAWLKGTYHNTKRYTRSLEKVDMFTAGQSVRLPSSIGNTPTNITHINITITLNSDLSTLDDLFSLTETLNYTAYFVNGIEVNDINDYLLEGELCLDLFFDISNLTDFIVNRFNGELVRIAFTEFAFGDDGLNNRDIEKMFSSGVIDSWYNEYLKTDSPISNYLIKFYWNFSKGLYFTYNGGYYNIQEAAGSREWAEFSVLPEYKNILD